MKEDSSISRKPISENYRNSRVVRIIALIATLTILSLPWIVHLDGKPHGDWEQFIGRFHPLVVHLPIGFLVLLPLLEIVGRSRPALREAASFVLALAFAACSCALALGYLLAHGSGDTGQVVVRHMWGGVVLTLTLLACLFARPSWSSNRSAYAYPALLTIALLTLVWTAHQGGTLTHGSNYMTEYMPAALKRFSHQVSAGNASSGSFYVEHIHPIFDANCVSCHGQSKSQGGLRLDSYSQLMSGGRDGIVIRAGNPGASLLFQRITLPQGDKHFMPAEGKPPLKPDEIALIQAWIQQGASPNATSIAGVSVGHGQHDLPFKPVGDYSSMMSEIQQMSQQQDAKLIPVSSKPSDGLILSAVDVAPNFRDAQLAQFQKFAPFIVEAELGRTAITDNSFDTLAKFIHLRALHLEGTNITGAGLAKLAPLSELTYLNLSETKVTSQAVTPLASMKNLRHIYLFNTPAQPAGDTVIPKGAQ